MYSKTKKSNAIIILASLAVTASISVQSGFASGLPAKLTIEPNNSSFQQIIEDSKVSIDELNAELSKLEEINKPLFSKYEKAKIKFDKANEECTRLKAEKNSLDQKQSTLDKEQLRKIMKKESCKAEKEEMEKISQQIKDLVKQIKMKEMSLKSARSQYDPINKKYQEANETINSVRTKIEEAKKMAEQAEKEREALALKLLEQEKMEEAQRKAEQEAQDRDLESKSAASENIFAKEELTEQDGKNDFVNQQNLNTMREEKIEKQRQIDKLKVEILGYEKRALKSKVDRERLVAECNVMQTEKDEADQEHQKLFAEFRLADGINDTVKVSQIVIDEQKLRLKSAYYEDVMAFDNKSIQECEALEAEASQTLENLHKQLEKAQEELGQIDKILLQETK